MPGCRVAPASCWWWPWRRRSRTLARLRWGSCSAGTLLGAALGTWLLAFALPPSMPLWLMLALPVIIGVGAVWGDLLESLIKRELGVKDAGAWLPGFGGLLDRADSLVVTIPLIYHLARLVMGHNP